MNNQQNKAVPAICKNCRHWKKIEATESKNEFGSCYRYPPAVVILHDEPTTLIPSTAYRHHCGEFEVRFDA